MTDARETDLFSVDTHLERVHACEREWDGAPLLLATPTDQRYPLVYPRDTAIILRAYDRLLDLGAVPHEKATAALEGASAFLLAAQGPEGVWGQRYDFDAKDRSIYPQEDNTALAVATLARHLRRARADNSPAPGEARELDAMTRALDAARERYFDAELGLYRSRTAVHESRIERGFTLWTNGAYRSALTLAADAARTAGRDAAADAWITERDALDRAIREHLVEEGRFIRRLTVEREPDLRADVTLLSPSYFGFADLDARAEAEGVAYLERDLLDPDLGLLRRYPSDPDDPGIQIHGGHGPYLSFSCWLAERYADLKEDDRAREILVRIAAQATADGCLPEHVATVESFHDFIENEWFTGRDFRKEFDPEVLLPNVGHGPILEEAARMTKAYAHALREAERAGDGVIRLAFPHAWTHVDFALALAILRAHGAMQ